MTTLSNILVSFITCSRGHASRWGEVIHPTITNLFHERDVYVRKARKARNQRLQSNTRQKENLQIHNLKRNKSSQWEGKKSYQSPLYQHAPKHNKVTCTVAFNPNALTETVTLGFAAHFTEGSIINSFSSVT